MNYKAALQALKNGFTGLSKKVMAPVRNAKANNLLTARKYGSFPIDPNTAQQLAHNRLSQTLKNIGYGPIEMTYDSGLVLNDPTKRLTYYLDRMANYPDWVVQKNPFLNITNKDAQHAFIENFKNWAKLRDINKRLPPDELRQMSGKLADIWDGSRSHGRILLDSDVVKSQKMMNIADQYISDLHTSRLPYSKFQEYLNASPRLVSPDIRPLSRLSQTSLLPSYGYKDSVIKTMQRLGKISPEQALSILKIKQ